MGSEKCMLMSLQNMWRLQVWISPGVVMMPGSERQAGSVTQTHKLGDFERLCPLKELAGNSPVSKFIISNMGIF